MEEKVLKGNINELNGIVYGQTKESVDGQEAVASNRPNKCTFITGAPGSGKTFYFVEPNIAQAIKRNDAIVCDDFGLEKYNMFKPILEENGYVVSCINLEGDVMDTWNCAREIYEPFTENVDDERLNTFVKTFVKNNEYLNKEWTATMVKDTENILKYVFNKCANVPEAFSLRLVREYLDKFSSYEEEYATLPIGNAAKIAYEEFQKLDDARQLLAVSLARKSLDFLVINEKLADTLCKKDPSLMQNINIKNFKRKAIFINTGYSKTNTLASLAYTFALRDAMYNYDNSNNELECCGVSIFMDESGQLGIPFGSGDDLALALCVCSKRNISFSICSQGITQLQLLAGKEAGKLIIATCGTKIFLGCTDLESYNYIKTYLEQFDSEELKGETFKNAIMVCIDYNEKPMYLKPFTWKDHPLCKK